MSLKGKKILLAISGSIAAYKTPQLVRLLIKAGAEVQVVMTEAAKDFVTPLALSTVSKKVVFSSVQNGNQWNDHVHLGRWADIFLLAPASANTLAKMSHGICDNMVQAVYLSANCPIFIAPAMDEDMWLHPATKKNVSALKTYGHRFLAVDHGELASGIIGYGRMAEPEVIIAELEHFFFTQPESMLHNGKRALVTAGPTYEPIDPVRFIGNFSTGKMGIAIAIALAEKGVSVDLVLGPTSEKVDHPLIKVHAVKTAQEMFEACSAIFPNVELGIMSAAVADYRPAQTMQEKIKKEASATIHLDLVKNPDILASLGKIKRSTQTLVGFALETENELENAKKKLISKKADLIILNSLKDENAGFGYDTNKVTFLYADGTLKELPLQSKADLAQYIVNEILT